MLKLFFSVLIMVSSSINVAAQSFSINTSGAVADNSAILDVSSTNKGVLVPRVALTGSNDNTTIVSPAASLLIYNTATVAGANAISPGYYSRLGGVWARESAYGSNNWALTGNAGTNPATNFIGTTDNQDVFFRRNNIPSGRIANTNTAFGLNAFALSNGGINNTAIGTSALASMLAANGNTAIGFYTLLNSTTGGANTAVGSTALKFNTTGSANVAVGLESMYWNTTGNYNVAVGIASLFSNTTGERNIAIGSSALENNTTGNNNTAVGYLGLVFNTTGSNNTANGYHALFSNTTGNTNTAIGIQALQANTIGNDNTVVGAAAMISNTTGTENTASGHTVMGNNTSGIRNVANGFQAMYNNSTADSNVAVGYRTLFSNSTGERNTAIGFQSLFAVSTGSNNIGLGNGAEVPTATASNQVRIGNTDITYAGVQVAWTITSDKRWKNNIQSSELGLDFIKKLNPVSYIRNNDLNKKTEYGFIAQELQTALQDAGAANNSIINTDNKGMLGVRYNDLLAPMVKAIQQLADRNAKLEEHVGGQQTLIEKQQAQLDQQQKQIADLIKQLHTTGGK